MVSEPAALRYLLLQARNQDDPMRSQEVRCFVRALQCKTTQIEVFDLLGGTLGEEQLSGVDVVLLGGSGDYSVAEGGHWLESALSSMRHLFDAGIPTFASCWGFQAMAQALGGSVITDIAHAEIGSVTVTLTGAGKADPLFAPIGPHFLAQMGHQDRVDRLPPGAVLLASSERVEVQAFCFPDRHIYCTQFHPELNRQELLERLEAYPVYVERISGTSVEAFAMSCQETPQAATLLRRFVDSIGPAVVNRP